jgi:hypothetical protein
MKGHTHICARCHRPFPCAGELLRNFDGYPEVICDLFHVQGNHFKECESCAMTAFCEHCGTRPATAEVDGDRVCQVCADALGAIRTRARRKSA